MTAISERHAGGEEVGMCALLLMIIGAAVALIRAGSSCAALKGL